jgi:hypothetical protein
VSCLLSSRASLGRPPPCNASRCDQTLSETVPKSEHDHAKVQHAAACLGGPAEDEIFVMHARTAAIQALKRNEFPPPFIESGKQFHWGKRKLKRDR